MKTCLNWVSNEGFAQGVVYKQTHKVTRKCRIRLAVKFEYYSLKFHYVVEFLLTYLVISS